MDRSLFFLGLIGAISVVAIALSRIIDKPAPGRNFMFSFFICILAFGLVFDLAQNDSLQIAGFDLGFPALLLFVCLIGVFAELVLVTIYRGNLRAGILSGGLTGITALFMGRLLPPSYISYENLHDWPSLIRIEVTLAIGFVSYVLIANQDDENESDDNISAQTDDESDA